MRLTTSTKKALAIEKCLKDTNHCFEDIFTRLSHHPTQEKGSKVAFIKRLFYYPNNTMPDPNSRHIDAMIELAKLIKEPSIIIKIWYDYRIYNATISIDYEELKILEEIVPGFNNIIKEANIF